MADNVQEQKSSGGGKGLLIALIGLVIFLIIAVIGGGFVWWQDQTSMHTKDLVSLSPAELAPGFSATYIGMALIATAALLVTLLALKRHELASKHA